MTNLCDVLLTEILPDIFMDAEKTHAYAQAERDVRRMIYGFAERTIIYMHLNEQEDHVLDLMASELKTQYYSTDLDHETKVQLIQNTLWWHIHAGATGAVQRMVEIVFGSGEVTEWFDYGGNPFYFKIKTDEDLSPDIMERFRELIKKVKNTCATLEEISISHDMEQNIYVSGSVYSESVINIS